MLLAESTIPILENLESKSNQEGFGLITDLGLYVSRIVSTALTVAGIAAFIYLIMGGVLWITSSGDKNKIEEARGRITNAIIGLVIVAASWAIFLLVDYFFGLKLTEGN